MLMTYTRDQLINALQHEYEYLIHDDFDPDVDMSATEHLAAYTLDMLMRNHG